MTLMEPPGAVCSPANYKSDVKPVWCPGCGDHGILVAFQRAMAELALPPEKIALVSGIGCSSRFPAYTNTYGFHGVHGRSLALLSARLGNGTPWAREPGAASRNAGMPYRTPAAGRT